MVLKHYFRRTFWNNLLNIGLQTKAKVITLTPQKEILKKVTPPLEYDLVFEDDFSGKFIDESKWRFSQPWGEFHNSQLWWYWPNSAVATQIEGNILKLELRYFPKTYKKSDLPKWKQSDKLPEEFTIKHAAGLISSKQEFKYGWFEAEIKLPKQANLWAAFWLQAKEKWPPEIDILEAFGDEEGNIDIRPNVHWGTSDKKGKRDYGGPVIAVENPTERFVHYACHWTEDFIKFYIDGSLVQVCNNKQMLKDLSEYPQYIVLNNGFKQKSTTDIYYSALEIKNVKVYQECEN